LRLETVHLQRPVAQNSSPGDPNGAAAVLQSIELLLVAGIGLALITAILVPMLLVFMLMFAPVVGPAAAIAIAVIAGHGAASRVS